MAFVRIMLINGVIPMPPATRTSDRSRYGLATKPPNGPSIVTISPGLILRAAAWVKSPLTLIANCSQPSVTGELTIEKQRTGDCRLWFLKLTAAYCPDLYGIIRRGFWAYNVNSKV